MLQRDYFLRVIEEFAKALSAFLEKKEDERKRDHTLRDLYRQYVGPYEDLRNLSFEETLQYADDQWSAAERLDRLDRPTCSMPKAAIRGGHSLRCSMRRL